MADIDKTPPIDGGNPPDNKIIDDTKINEIIEKQFGTLKDDFMKKFSSEYGDKISKLQSSQKELDEKKQRLAVIDELKAAKMDSSLIDYVYDKDIEISKVKIKQLGDLIAAEVQKGVEERIKSSSYVPPENDNNSDFLGNFKRPKYVV